MHAKLPDMSLAFPINRAGVELLAAKEGCRLRAYRNFPNEPWTCGWGETDGVGPNTIWTQEYADQRLCDSLKEYAEAVLEACTVAPNENELAAFTVFAYNIGLGWKGKKKPRGAKDGFRNSTALKLHNAGKRQECAQAMLRWCRVDDGKGGKRELESLKSRRMEEGALYLRPVPGAVAPVMPQAVEPETTLAKSPTAALAGAGAVASAGTAVSDLLESVRTAGVEVATLKEPVSGIKGFAIDTLGIPSGAFSPAFATVCLVVFVIILWRRFNQRDRGVA